MMHKFIVEMMSTHKENTYSDSLFVIIPPPPQKSGVGSKHVKPLGFSNKLLIFLLVNAIISFVLVFILPSHRIIPRYNYFPAILINFSGICKLSFLFQMCRDKISIFCIYMYIWEAGAVLDSKHYWAYYVQSIEYKSVFCTTIPILNNSSFFFSVLLIFFSCY